MKILQVPFHYYPEAVGGTEVYVSSLAKRLEEQGIEVEIAAPGDSSAEYIHDGLPVHRFGVTKTPADLAMLYGKGDPVATAAFVKILDRCQPDLVHLHSMSPAVSLHVLKEVKQRGLPAVFTCHIPGITCPRGTLLRYGNQVCDGVWGLEKCTACTLQAQGLPAALAELLSAVPGNMGRGLAAYGLRGSAITALRMRELQAGRQRALVEFLNTADRIVAVSGWLRDLLVANGVDRDKVLLCRHGSSQRTGKVARIERKEDGVFKLAFLGRLNPTKGAHILVEAIRRRPRISILLDIFGIVQDDLAYVEKLRDRIDGDSRIQFRESLPNEDVVNRLRDYDALAVPSQWMETGPLVVYDAFLAGIPVIGSKRGGLMELIIHEGDGLLVEPADPEAWAEALERLSCKPQLRERLRAGVRPPRSMAAVASEMLELYGAVSSALRPIHHG